MKSKFLIFTCIITFIMSIFVTSLDAAIESSTLLLSANKTSYNVGDEVVFTFKLDNLEADKGIIAYGATLEYDKTKLEFVKMTGEGKWNTPSYNKENGKLVADRNDDYSSKSENLCTIVFKAKAASTSGTQVTLKDITLANGGSGVATSKDIKTSVKITTTSSTNQGNSNGSSNSGNSNNQNNQTNSSDNNNPNEEVTDNDNSSDNVIDNTDNVDSDNKNNDVTNGSQTTQDNNNSEESENSGMKIIIYIVLAVIILAVIIGLIGKKLEERNSR